MGYFIDISNFQGKLKSIPKDVDKAIVRVGYTGWLYGGMVKDKSFSTNAALFDSTDQLAGIYWFSQAVNVQEARAEAVTAMTWLKEISNKRIPVYIDTEWSGGFFDETGKAVRKGRADKLSREVRTEVVNAFLDEVRQCGYPAGVYTGEAWAKEELNWSDINADIRWIAKYSKGQPETACDIWQYGQQQIDGFADAVDVNLELQQDYPELEENWREKYQALRLEIFKLVEKYR